MYLSKVFQLVPKIIELKEEKRFSLAQFALNCTSLINDNILKLTLKLYNI